MSKGEYYSTRIWLLRAGCTGAELEELAASGYLEMQRWIPGVKHLSLVRLSGEQEGRYLLRTTFANYETYMYWRQVEEEAPDYWERYAAILMQWDQLCTLAAEYTGLGVLDTRVDTGVRAN
ncbi:MAG TPA: hypothetical protein VNG51_22330 [Ktedonobacteraceae bacterium]|nr:hypothetical protein [Ktedonobacteraceae bacterium]